MVIVKALKVIGARDPLLWYADKVGCVTPYLQGPSESWGTPEEPAYLSREDAGYTNIVFEKDAEVIYFALEGNTLEKVGYHSKDFDHTLLKEGQKWVVEEAKGGDLVTCLITGVNHEGVSMSPSFEVSSLLGLNFVELLKE